MANVADFRAAFPELSRVLADAAIDDLLVVAGKRYAGDDEPRLYLAAHHYVLRQMEAEGRALPEGDLFRASSYGMHYRWLIRRRASGPRGWS